MSRNLTPLPARTGRAGTFDGMEKLFFERAAAIEAGEKTAPPEIIGVPHTHWRRWLAQLAALELYQKIGLAAGLLFMVAAAVLTLRGGATKSPVESHALPVQVPAAPAVAQPYGSAPGASKPAASVRPGQTRHARTKHARASRLASKKASHVKAGAITPRAKTVTGKTATSKPAGPTRR